MLSVIAVGWWWHRRKIERIEATGEQSSRQIEKLKRQVAERHDQLSARLHVGTNSTTACARARASPTLRARTCNVWWNTSRCYAPCSGISGSSATMP